MSEETLSIGDLASCSGLSVKTIRYYSDIGLLEGRRSPGGHRRYGPEMVERIRLIKRLRALHLPISTVTQVVTGDRSLADLVTGELHHVEERLAQLRWREATLKALDDCTDQERLRRLEVLSRVQQLPRARLDLLRTWEEKTSALPSSVADTVISQAVPEPPADPSPQMALHYAELHALAEHPGLAEYLHFLASPQGRYDASYYVALVDLLISVQCNASGDRPLNVGEDVDRFVAFFTRARAEDDDPRFRAALAAELRGTAALAFRHYTQHLAALTGRPNLGTAYCWMVDALPGPRAL